MDTKALRQKILDLAIRGQLVPQNPDDEPASVLLERIRAEKQEMVADGRLKAKDIKNDTIIFRGEDNLHYEKFTDGSTKCIEDEIPFEIPEGWEWCRIGTVFTTITGGTPSTKDRSLYGNEYPFYKPTDLDAGFQVVTAGDSVSEKGFLSGRVVLPFSVLVTCIGATIGKTGLIRVAGICNQQINAILPNSCVAPEYTYFFMSSGFGQDQIISNSSATTLPILNKSRFDNLLFALPPYKVQLKIAEQIEIITSYIDALDCNQLYIKDLISTTRAHILDLAIRGKLVPQNPDDEPASVLLDRIRAEKEELIKQGKIKRDKRESVIFRGEDNSYYTDLPETWITTTLNDITTSASLNDGDWILSKNMNSSGKVKLIQLGSIGEMHFINKGFKYLTEETFDALSCTQIYSGYLLVNRIINDKMCACILPEIDGTLITTVDTCWVAPNDMKYDLNYLLIVLSSPLFQQLVLMNTAGTTRKRISKNNLIQLPFPLPPIREQRRIADAVKHYLSILDSIATQIA